MLAGLFSWGGSCGKGLLTPSSDISEQNFPEPGALPGPRQPPVLLGQALGVPSVVGPGLHKAATPQSHLQDWFCYSHLKTQTSLVLVIILNASIIYSSVKPKAVNPKEHGKRSNGEPTVRTWQTVTTTVSNSTNSSSPSHRKWAWTNWNNASRM